MKTRVRAAIVGSCALHAAALLALAVAQSATAAQMTPADVDKMVKYSQCIRTNGYPEFPDPSPDGRLQIKVDPKSAGKLEAAQRACKDKAPGGLPAMDAPMTAERMQALLGFAACMRGKGLNGFPDPSPQGFFDIGSASADLMSAQSQQAAKACMESNPAAGGFMIRRAPPK